MNFLAETLNAIAQSGHTPADIVFIGSTESGHACTWEEFTALADFDYDDGYGWQEIACDLRIVFSDGSDMHRDEYDGNERWDFSHPFVMPDVLRPIHTLRHTSGWQNLAEQQGDE